jgi:hypothetical protein
MPFSAPVLMVVTCFAAPSSAGTTHSCVVPERLDSKRMNRPSGDQRGLESFFPFSWASCRGAREPSVGAMNRAVLLLFSSRLTVVTW